MKLDKNLIIAKLTVIAGFIKRFRFIIVFAIFGMMYAYILNQVNAINTQQPSDSKIAEKATGAPQTRVDEDLVKKITSLEEENVQVKTIYNEARKNPFDE